MSPYTWQKTSPRRPHSELGWWECFIWGAVNLTYWHHKEEDWWCPGTSGSDWSILTQSWCRSESCPWPLKCNRYRCEENGQIPELRGVDRQSKLNDGWKDGDRKFLIHAGTPPHTYIHIHAKLSSAPGVMGALSQTSCTGGQGSGHQLSVLGPLVLMLFLLCEGGPA